jgi:AbrB family looped-hinge helix DNA binding protein
MNESVVTSKGQTTLPKSVRSSLGLGPGDRVRYFILDGEVRLIKARSVVELKGILRRAGTVPKSLEEMQRGIEKGAIEGSK